MADEATVPEVRVEVIPDGWVYIRHPKVAVDALVSVESVPMHRHAGWELVPEEPAADESPELPAGNASADAWREYATYYGVNDADAWSRDELRDHYLSGQPLPLGEVDSPVDKEE